MRLNFRFAIVSDLHIALPHTIWDNPNRFHLVEVSIPVLEIILEHLEQLDLDVLLLPGDLTQHGESENHAWLQQRLAQLPYPVYVVPGNHDVPVPQKDGHSIGLNDFSHYYGKCGYENPYRLYYTCEILPGVRLIGLNSNQFDPEGKQLGYMDDAQLTWLKGVLASAREELVMVMIHHNVMDHLPHQSSHQLGRRYMLDNGPVLLHLLRNAGVQLIFTGHLHVQDIACDRGIYEITTGSLVSYPHPYRILHFQMDDRGRKQLRVESHRIEAVPGWPTLAQTSREWIGDRSHPFLLKLLIQPPSSLPLQQAKELVSSLRYFWADIANGDAMFNFPHFPPATRAYFESFSAMGPDGTPQAIDNYATLVL
ncbi:MAG: metallophosphoesterase [Hormoscilla sp. GM102CHS1]|nr:metallophosphoesterase [Hormoscilla sp. GM102CHS1]